MKSDYEKLMELMESYRKRVKETANTADGIYYRAINKAYALGAMRAGVALSIIPAKRSNELSDMILSW